MLFRQQCFGIFPVQCCQESRTTLEVQGFCLCNIVVKIIKTTLKMIFLVEYYLEPQGQHYIGFFFQSIVVPGVLRQHCKRFQTVVWNLLGNIAQHFCAMVFQQPATFFKEALTKVFSCQFWKISKNTFSYRTPVTASVLRQHWAGFFPVHCCPEPLSLEL